MACSVSHVNLSVTAIRTRLCSKRPGDKALPGKRGGSNEAYQMFRSRYALHADS